MRSGHELPGQADGSGQPAPPGFPAEALKPAAVGIVTSILAAWTVGLALRAMSTPRPLTVLVYYGVLFGGLVRAALGASTRWGTGSLRDDFGWWARQTDLLRAVPVMWLAGVAGAIATAPWHGAWDSNADWVATADTASVVIFSGFAIVAAPLFEELVFRGLLQRALTSRYGVRPAIVVQGVAFGLYHLSPTRGINVATIVFIAAGGIVFGMAAHRCQRLGPTMLAHALTNILATAALIAS